MNKPLLVDFNGWACVNSRKMEQNTVYTPKNAQIIHENFVVVTLYVDDRGPVPAVYSDLEDKNGNPFKNYGAIWLDLEANMVNMVSQPVYIIVDNEGNIINGKATYGSHSKEEQFNMWLLQGLQKFKNK